MVANDFPFSVGDKVGVIRHEHGWHDGNLIAVITYRYKNANGIWKYGAVCQDEDYDGMEIELNHTRDAIKF